jgi:hypothetical protein
MCSKTTSNVHQPFAIEAIAIVPFAVRQMQRVSTYLFDFIWLDIVLGNVLDAVIIPFQVTDAYKLTCLPQLILLRIKPRQPDGERRPFSWLALRLDPPAVRLDDPLRDG